MPRPSHNLLYFSFRFLSRKTQRTFRYVRVFLGSFCYKYIFVDAGNGNNEPYDDFTLPSGKIVTSESNFGNSYKIGVNCPAVQTVDHSKHVNSPACNKYFGADSSLRSFFRFVNPENYRTACNHGIAQGIADTEYATVAAYITALNLRGFSAKIPKNFGKFCYFFFPLVSF